MTDKEIIQIWRSGLDKKQVSLIYKRRYNHRIKIIRSEMKNRHKGRFITNYEALRHVESVLYKELKNN